MTDTPDAIALTTCLDCGFLWEQTNTAWACPECVESVNTPDNAERISLPPLTQDQREYLDAAIRAGKWQPNAALFPKRDTADNAERARELLHRLHDFADNETGCIQELLEFERQAEKRGAAKRDAEIARTLEAAEAMREKGAEIAVLADTLHNLAETVWYTESAPDEKLLIDEFVKAIAAYDIATKEPQDA